MVKTMCVCVCVCVLAKVESHIDRTNNAQPEWACVRSVSKIKLRTIRADADHFRMGFRVGDN